VGIALLGSIVGCTVAPGESERATDGAVRSEMPALTDRPAPTASADPLSGTGAILSIEDVVVR
jgi:hypothetical protein